MNSNNRFLHPILLVGMLGFLLMGCSKKEADPAPGPVLPSVTTVSILDITQTSATCGGTVTSDGGAMVTYRGICWSQSPKPQITDSHTSDGTGTGTFTSVMTGLTPNTLYYARAYASSSKGTAYGDSRSFTTLKVPVDSVSDIDGNIYHVVPIGTRFWLRENLRVTKYRNGDPIPIVTSDALWKNLTSGATCLFDHLPSNGVIYGNLYNWYALSDPRGICPAGWHVASDAEWSELGDFLGGADIAGGKLKSTGTLEEGNGLWYTPNTGATNSSGFTGLPGGYRINYGNFYSMGNVGYFWSSSDTASINAWNFILDANNGELKRNYNLKANGFSIRCCKD